MGRKQPCVCPVCSTLSCLPGGRPFKELKLHSPNKRFSKLDQISMEFVGAFYSLNDLWPYILWELSTGERWIGISSLGIPKSKITLMQLYYLRCGLQSPSSVSVFCNNSVRCFLSWTLELLAGDFLFLFQGSASRNVSAWGTWVLNSEPLLESILELLVELLYLWGFSLKPLWMLWAWD